MYTTYADEPPTFDVDNMWYLCYQREICPTTGNAHWQSYVEFRSPQRPAGAAKLLGGVGHFCVRGGTREEAIAYCKKKESAVPDTFQEFGDPARVEQGKAQGKRSDLQVIAEAIQDGVQPDEIAELNPVAYIRYNRGIEKLHRAINRNNRRTWWTSLVIIWGPPGTGKTRQVWAREGVDNVYAMPERQPGQPVWFDGYTGQRAVLIDDLEPGDYRLGSLLRWSDRYPCQVPIKGSHVELLAKRLYITSNHDPRQWFPQYQGNIPPALQRRIEEGGGEVIHQEDEWIPDSPTTAEREASNSLLRMSRSPRQLAGGRSQDAAILIEDDE